MKSVLFVCTANRCRSPMAAALLKDRVARRGQSDEWAIASAGTWAAPNLPATLLAQAEMTRRGLDLTAHRTRVVTADMLKAASLVLVMTRSHRESLCVEFPESAHKVMLLSELIGQSFDVEDPVLGAARDYEQCAEEIDQIMEKGFEKMAALADGRDKRRMLNEE
ncbi:MAG TPA: hypothetical protein VJL59_25520 [Anaerolineales bacterium]|nr:hypothetical protein [Anaerolineales bacterium]